MKKINYVLIRYSVLIKNTKSWSIANTDLDIYAEKLFDPIRLDQHLELFTKITLPSITNQTKKVDSEWLKVFLITSSSLPLWHKIEIEKIVNKYSWLELSYLPEEGYPLEHAVFKDLEKYNEEVLFSTIRLDDDDALSNKFFEKIDKYFCKNHVGYGFSFGYGYAGFYDFKNQRYEKIVDYYYPKFSAGLAYFNLFDGENNKFSQHVVKTIFNAGGHSKVDLNIPLILDSKEKMFIRTMHGFSDSYLPKRELLLKNKPFAKYSDVIAKFPSVSDLDSKIKRNYLDGVDKEYLNGKNELIYYIYNIKKPSENFLAVFNAAISKRAHKTPPFFSARTIAKELDMSLVSFSDPIVDKNNNLTLGWYLGDTEHISLNRVIKDIIRKISISTGKRPVLFGCSGGGFAALVQSMYLSAMEIPHDVIVCNPQTDIFKYKQLAVDRYFKYAKSTHSLINEKERRNYLRDIGSISKVNLGDVLSDFCKIYYIQNVNDDFHITNHLIPFIEGQSFSDKINFSIGEQKYENFNLIVDDFGSDHAAPTNEWFSDFISNKLLSVETKTIPNFEKTIIFKNRKSGINYEIKIAFNNNLISVYLLNPTGSFNINVNLIVNGSLSGKILSFNEDNISGNFDFDWFNKEVDISVLQLDLDAKYSKRYKLYKPS